MAPLFLESLDKSEKWRAREKSRRKSWIMPCWEKYAVFFILMMPEICLVELGNFFPERWGNSFRLRNGNPV